MAAIATSLGTRRRRRTSIGQILLYLVLIAVGIVILMPILYMVSQAFTPEQDTLTWGRAVFFHRAALLHAVSSAGAVSSEARTRQVIDVSGPRWSGKGHQSLL